VATGTAAITSSAKGGSKRRLLPNCHRGALSLRRTSTERGDIGASRFSHQQGHSEHSVGFIGGRIANKSGVSCLFVVLLNLGADLSGRILRQMPRCLSHPAIQSVQALCPLKIIVTARESARHSRRPTVRHRARTWRFGSGAAAGRFRRLYRTPPSLRFQLVKCRIESAFLEVQ